MSGQNLIERLGDRLKGLRGKLVANAGMDKITWFRTGGAAEALFQPQDEEDLAEFLRVVPEEIPITLVGIGSNLLVRDGGLDGFVVRLSAKGFGWVEQTSDTRLEAGAALPDKRLAAKAQEAGHWRLPLLPWYSRRAGWRAQDEWWRQWRGNL